MRYNRVTYYFRNLDTGEYWKLPDDPKGWDESDRTTKRSEKNFSIFTELSKNLIFTKAAHRKLKSWYSTFYIEARVQLEEWRPHPQTSVEELYSVGDLDFSQIEIYENETKVPFTTGGLNTLLKSYLDDKFELDRLESVNGKTINPLETTTAALTSRKILLISQLKNANDQSSTFSMLGPPRVPEMEIVSQADEENVYSTFGDTYAYGSSTSDQFFYLINDRVKTLTITVTWNVDVWGGGFGTVNFQPAIVRYHWDGSSHNQVEIIYLDNEEGVYEPTRSFWGSSTVVIEDLPVDDSLIFVLSSVGGDSPTTGYSQTLMYSSENFVSTKDGIAPGVTIEVLEDSFVESSTSKVALYHEVGDKLAQIITGEQNRFYSDFYGRTDIGYAVDGEYAYTALAPGFWIRQFDDEKFETSLKDYLENSNCIHNTGWGVEILNGVETLVLEDQKHFFRPRIIAELGEVNDLKIVPADDFLHSSLEFGYKKPDDDNLYEEAMGLDEYNTKSRFVNNLTRADDTYDKISPYRADSYGKEFARRKLKLNFPEEDTRYDNDTFVLDCKKSEGPNLEERVWQDDYETEPTGVYSPETATNLRLTPYRNSERHHWITGSIVKKFQTEKVRYASGIGNKELTTDKAGEEPRSERYDILVSDMAPTRFSGEYATFKRSVDYELSRKVNGTFNVNGRAIPNAYGLFGFTFNGKKRYGYLMELKPNKEGQWKLLI